MLHILTRIAKNTRIQLLLTGFALFSSMASGQMTQAKIFDPDGTVHVPAYSLSQGDLVSDAFKDAYAKHLSSVVSWPLHPPALNAPKDVWDKWDADTDRAVFGPSAKFAEEHYQVNFQDTTLGGVHVGIVTPKSGIAPQNAHRVLINLHGGGFIMGRGLTAAKGEAIPVASVGGFKIVTVDYRMVPYAKFPAASEDIETVYRELLKTYKPTEIGIYGCSAGGRLTSQFVAWLQSKDLPRPGAVGIFCAAAYPLYMGGDSTMWGGTGIPVLGLSLPKPGSMAAAAMPANHPANALDYTTDADPNDPRVNPSASDAVLAKFPPTLWITGTRSGEMSPVLVSHARFLKLGVDSYLYVQEGGQHGYYNIGEEDTPEGRDTVSYIARWFQQHLAR